MSYEWTCTWIVIVSDIDATANVVLLGNCLIVNVDKTCSLKLILGLGSKREILFPVSRKQSHGAEC